MSLDLILRQGRLTGSKAALVDIGVSAGRIVDIAARIDAEAAEEEQLDGRLVIAAFVETHIHLDKSCILERCNCERGTLAEAIETVAAAKRAFTEADIHARAQPPDRRPPLGRPAPGSPSRCCRRPTCS